MQKKQRLTFELPPEIVLHILSYYPLDYQNEFYITRTPTQRIKLFFGRLHGDIVLIFHNIDSSISDSSFIQRTAPKESIYKLPPCVHSLDISKTQSPQVFAFKKLTSLRVRSMTLPRTFMKTLCETLPQLRHLDFKKSELISGGTQHTYLTRFTNLRVLVTSSICMLSINQVNAILTSLPKLQKLSVSYFCSSYASCLIQFSTHPSLRKLRLSSTNARELTIQPNKLVRSLHLTDVIVSAPTTRWIFSNQLEELKLEQTITFETDYRELYETHPPPVLKIQEHEFTNNSSISSFKLVGTNGELYQQVVTELSVRRTPLRVFKLEQGIDAVGGHAMFQNENIASGIVELELYLFDKVNELLDCDLVSLRSLRLRSCEIADPKIFIKFNELTTLEFINCEFAKDGFIPTLIQPLALEKFVIEGELLTVDDTLAVSSKETLEEFTTDYALTDDQLRQLFQANLTTLFVKDNTTTPLLLELLAKSSVRNLGVRQDDKSKWLQLYNHATKVFLF